MFKIVLVLAALLVSTTEAENLSCKVTPISAKSDGNCASGYIKAYSWCCHYKDVFDADEYRCKQEVVGPVIEGLCPTGYSAVNEVGFGVACCDKKFVYKKN